MTLLAVALAVGFLAGRLGWLLLRGVLAGPLFLRYNYRGRDLPTAAGLVVVVALAGVEAARVVAGLALGDDSRPGASRGALVLLALGLGLLGLVDDLAGDADRRGFRGHVRSMLEGRLTTGGLKLFGGGAVAVVAVAILHPRGALGEVLVDAALVALAANLGNLLDRAPGRTIKVGAVCFGAVVLATAASASLVPAAVVVGASLALLLEDLHERVMLGDTGANVLGGALGLGVVAAGTPVTRLAVLAGLAVLNGLSEWVSFSRVIERVAPLRAFDRAGRRDR